MPQQLLQLINDYGYFILFGLVFIQEIGIPTFPNEITLSYFGFLCSQKSFVLAKVIAVAVSADMIGTLLMYSVFYFFGNRILNSNNFMAHKISKKINAIKQKKVIKNKFFILGRLTPFVRGYTSVFAGVTQHPFKIYIKQVLFTATFYNTLLICVGYFLGNTFFINNPYSFNSFIFIKLFLIFTFLIFIALKLFKIKSKVTIN